MRSGANTDIINYDGDAPLHVAARSGDQVLSLSRCVNDLQYISVSKRSSWNNFFELEPLSGKLLKNFMRMLIDF